MLLGIWVVITISSNGLGCQFGDVVHELLFVVFLSELDPIYLL